MARRSAASAVLKEFFPTWDVDAVRERLTEELRAAMNYRPPPYERKGDGRDWARAIVARVAAGESVGVYPELIAREVLAMPTDLSEKAKPIVEELVQAEPGESA